MAKRRRVADIAQQRGTSVDDVLAHLKKAGIEVTEGHVNVDEEAIERAYATPAGPRRSRGAPPAGGRRRRVVIDAGASRRGGGPQGGPRNRRGRRGRPDHEEEQPVAPPSDQVVKIPSGASVKDVSQLLGVATPEIIKVLMGYGEMVTITQSLSDEAVTTLADDFGRKVEIAHAADEEVELAGRDPGRARGPQAARSRDHGHGPRRPRQDESARRHPRDRGGGR